MSSLSDNILPFEITDKEVAFLDHISSGIGLVAFDVDSTVFTCEFLDEYAAWRGYGDITSELTRKAMNGEIDVASSLRDRITFLSPTESSFHEFLSLHPPTLSPSFLRVYMLLQQYNIPIVFISGGFTSCIVPSIQKALHYESQQIKKHISFLPCQVYANWLDHSTVPPTVLPLSDDILNNQKSVILQTIISNYDALYQSFLPQQNQDKYIFDIDNDNTTQVISPTEGVYCPGSPQPPTERPESPPSKSLTGKAVLMIGDGMNDAKARPPATWFVGYGGVIKRPAVQATADLYIDHFDRLHDLFTHHFNGK